MVINIVEALINSPLTPHERVMISRRTPFVKPNGSEGILTEEIGTYTVMAMPPDTTNNADGAILEQLMAGNQTKKVMILYGVMPLVKVGDFVKRIETDKLTYEVKVVSPHAVSGERTPITHDKLYVVLKDDQKHD